MFSTGIYLLIKIKEHAKICESEDMSLRKEYKNISVILIVFSMSYLLRYIWDQWVWKLLYSNDKKEFFIYLTVSYSLCLFFDIIPLSCILIFHHYNLKPKEKSPPRIKGFKPTSNNTLSNTYFKDTDEVEYSDTGSQGGDYNERLESNLMLAS